MKKIITILEHQRIIYYCDKCGSRINIERLNKKLEICAECDEQTNFADFMKNEATRNYTEDRM